MGSMAGVEKVAATRAGISLEAYRAKVAGGEKYCWRCKAWKPREMFGVDRHRSDGLSASCVTCRRKPGAKPKRPLDDPERQARNAVNGAVRLGRLAQVRALPCIDCGKPAREYDHHMGYDRAHWLDVQAVCAKCHRRRDKVRRGE